MKKRAQNEIGLILVLFVALCGVGVASWRANAQGVFGAGTSALGGLVGGSTGGVSAVLSFGGRIITQPTPCLNGALWMLVAQPPPKQPSVIPMIWTPGTLTFLWGPPSHAGQSILGTYDIPYVCALGAHIAPLHGFRMKMIGTSP